MNARYWVELSGENLGLGRAEATAVAGLLGGGAVEDNGVSTNLAMFDLPSKDVATELARRLALARRVIEEWPSDRVAERLRQAGRDGRSAVVRRLGHGSAPTRGALELALFRAYIEGGGRVDLASPERTFWVRLDEAGLRWGEEVAATDRRTLERRRLPKLPFRRPVALPPRLGRATVNLARVRSGDRVVDPFLGTGALLAEACVLGASGVGVDSDAEMVRGAARNLEALHVAADELVVDDAAKAASRYPDGSFDALVTDPPYGRASTTGGESPAELTYRALTAWAPKISARGRIAVVVPVGTEWNPVGWVLEHSVRDRVHASLTREFRAYRRTAGAL
ncbi:MAG TPA: RsmD family RNA methyltransferase [Thermoplasmata archaeon]|nr:RsmD family RNA methyltransferase [Thermoplasmata archaeon]